MPVPEYSDRSSICVLVVEDDALVRMHGVDLLEDAGFSVIEAENADEAIAILGRAPPVRLLFTDIDMPGTINGLELAELVHQRWPDIRLLVTSGHHCCADADLPDAGRFVAKPYSDAAVVSQVEALLTDSTRH